MSDKDQKLSVPDFIKSLVGRQNTASLVMEALKKGTIKQEDVYAHFKAEYAPIIINKVRKFQAGNLFVSQRQTFGTWLACTDRWKDLKDWDEFQKDVYMADLKPDSKEVEPIYRFALSRVVSPSPADRKYIIEGAGSFAEKQARERWSLTNVREGWRWMPSET